MNSREKGKRGELEWAKVLRDYGFDEARRGQQYNGADGSADVVGVPDVHWEVKRVEHLNIYDALEQAWRDSKEGEISAVAHRKNRCPWIISFYAEDILPVIREWSKRHEG